MSEQSAEGQDVALVPWDYSKALRKVDAGEVRLSRGFLRSKPEKWFPGFATHWLPLTHSLGLEFKVEEVRPLLHPPQDFEIGFAGSIDDEPIALFTDSESARAISDAVTPNAIPQARDVVLEYMARRFLASLALSWTGPESSVVSFDPDTDPRHVRGGGAVRILLSLNGREVSLVIILGKFMVERLDGLWRRQMQSTAKAPASGDTETLHIEIAQLAVPPSMLVEYMRSGTIIDLEVPATESVILRRGDKPWLLGRMCNSNSNLAVEILPGPVPVPGLPEGTTRLCIELGNMSLSPTVLAEMGQTGALIETTIPLSDRTHIFVNGERVGGASLCVYEGRYAITVD